MLLKQEVELALQICVSGSSVPGALSLLRALSFKWVNMVEMASPLT